jgi:signal transduction histidine kinase
VLTPTLLYLCLYGLHVVKIRAGLFFPVILALGACLYFTFFLPHSEYSPIVLYAPLPLLILAATTLPPVGVSTAISLLALVSILSAVEGKGAFFMVQSEHRVLAMQLFLIVISVPMPFVSILIEERKAVETELSESQATLQKNFKVTEDLAGRLLNAQEEERRRIARELHDDIGQRLALLSVGLDEWKSGLPAGFENENNPTNGLIAEVRSIADDIKGISRQLHSSTLETLGLEAALKNLCLTVARQHHTAVQFQSCNAKELSADLNLCLFRVAQEALSNAVRHGKAKRIEVSLQRGEDILSMKIIDEGDGFDPATLSSGLGLMSMRERVRFLGGTLSIQSRAGAGTRVFAELPLRKSA